MLHLPVLKEFLIRPGSTIKLGRPHRRLWSEPTLSGDLGPEFESAVGAAPAGGRSWDAAVEQQAAAFLHSVEMNQLHREAQLHSDCALQTRSSDICTTTTASRIAGILPGLDRVQSKAVPRVYDVRRSLRLLLLLLRLQLLGLLL